MAPSASYTAVREGPARYAGARRLTPLVAPDSAALPGPRATPPTEPLKIVLTARSWLAARPAVIETLGAGRYLVHTTAAWDQLLDRLDTCQVDVVIVDLDDANRCRRHHLFDMSGQRLVALLGRLAASRHFALVVQTALDFAEIDNLARQGIDTLVSPETPDDRLVHAIQAATNRVTAARGWGAGSS